MNAVAKALRDALLADAPLTALLGSPTGVYEDVAPQGSTHPFVVFSLNSGPKEFTFDGLAFDKPLYLVKAVDGSKSAAKAGAIAERIEAVLTDAALTIAGRDHVYLRPETEIAYSEVKDSTTYRHRGALYRLYIA